MNPNHDYVTGLLGSLQRLKAQESEIIDKLAEHFQNRYDGLHQRYMRLDTENAKLKEQVREIEERVRVLEEGATNG